MDQNTDETTTLNGRPISADKLEEQRKAAANQTGAELKEVKKGDWRMKLNG